MRSIAKIVPEDAPPHWFNCDAYAIAIRLAQAIIRRGVVEPRSKTGSAGSRGSGGTETQSQRHWPPSSSARIWTSSGKGRSDGPEAMPVLRKQRHRRDASRHLPRPLGGRMLRLRRSDAARDRGARRGGQGVEPADRVGYSRRRDSSPRPPDYGSGALPSELRRILFFFQYHHLEVADLQVPLWGVHHKSPETRVFLGLKAQKACTSRRKEKQRRMRPDGGPIARAKAGRCNRAAF